MPMVEVYGIDFAYNNDLHPSYDAHGWGNMKFGGSPGGGHDYGFLDGLGMTVTTTHHPDLGPIQQPPHVAYKPGPHLPPPLSQPTSVAYKTASQFTPPLAQATEGVSAVYVVIPPKKPLVRETRLNLHVEFDCPNATPEGTGPVQPWAVPLRIKLGNEIDAPGDHALISVTCQFNATGVKLADPDRAQDDGPINLIHQSPLRYEDFQSGPVPMRFSLDFAYCGMQAGPGPGNLGYAVGCGLLDIIQMPDSPNWQATELTDRRVFSSTKLSAPVDATIGALGVAVGTNSFAGTMSARLRQFSVSMWRATP